MTTVTEVQGPVPSIIYECIKLFEVVIMVAPVAHTHPSMPESPVKWRYLPGV